jgi:hypothetical protein
MESVNSAAQPGAVLQVKVRLLGLSPMVWRRVLVSGSVPLRAVHRVVQLAMGSRAGTAIAMVADGSHDLVRG